jgi:hypothetical protein
MKLDVIIDDKTHRIEVPPDMLAEAEEFFQKMDRDMDAGWQMGPEFVEHPSTEQRCQIAANKLLVSVSAQNPLLVQLMAGYILKRLPGVQTVDIDTAGEMLNTELVFAPDARPAPRAAAASATEAHAQAEQDVSPVYQVGKAWRFAVRDRSTGQWLESPFAASEDEARQRRASACARLAAQLARGPQAGE